MMVMFIKLIYVLEFLTTTSSRRTMTTRLWTRWFLLQFNLLNKINQRAWKAKLDRFHRQDIPLLATWRKRWLTPGSPSGRPRWPWITHALTVKNKKVVASAPNRSTQRACARNLPGSWERVGIEVTEWEVRREHQGEVCHHDEPVRGRRLPLQDQARNHQE